MTEQFGFKGLFGDLTASWPTLAWRRKSYEFENERNDGGSMLRPGEYRRPPVPLLDRKERGLLEFVLRYSVFERMENKW